MLAHVYKVGAAGFTGVYLERKGGRGNTDSCEEIVPWRDSHCLISKNRNARNVIDVDSMRAKANYLW